MNCPKCGTALEDDSIFCTACGTHLGTITDTKTASPNLVTTKNSDQQNPMTDKTKVPETPDKRSVNFIGLITGTLIIIVGLIQIMSAGTSISPTSFGGDFYTYTYEGIVAISEILASIEVSIGCLTVAIGAALDVWSLRR